jgi:hypothetical protein
MFPPLHKSEDFMRWFTRLALACAFLALPTAAAPLEVRAGSALDATASATVKIQHSTVRGSDLALDRGAGSVLRVATSLVAGPGFGTPTCVFTYDENFASTNCGPPIG